LIQLKLAIWVERGFSKTLVVLLEDYLRNMNQDAVSSMFYAIVEAYKGQVEEVSLLMAPISREQQEGKDALDKWLVDVSRPAVDRKEALDDLKEIKKQLRGFIDCSSLRDKLPCEQYFISNIQRLLPSIERVNRSIEEQIAWALKQTDIEGVKELDELREDSSRGFGEVVAAVHCFARRVTQSLLRKGMLSYWKMLFSPTLYLEQWHLGHGSRD
jgi:hypothetical protein